VGAFADLDDYVNRMTGGNSGAPENLFFNKLISGAGGSLIPNPAAPGWTSAWRWDGIPNAGAAAAAVAACDKTTTGALQFTNSAGSAVKRLVQGMGVHADYNNSGLNTILVMDRLLACGGLSGTVTTAQTVGGSIGRYTDGVGNQIWIEIQTLIGTTLRSVTVSYTNEDGTSGRTTTPRQIGSSAQGLAEVHVALPCPLAADDRGVQSVQSITLSGSTGTAGDIAVVIYHPIAMLVGPGLPLGPFGSLGAHTEIVDDACLTFLSASGAVARYAFAGMLSTVDV
jgi:hypothetical protein